MHQCDVEYYLFLRLGGSFITIFQHSFMMKNGLLNLFHGIFHPFKSKHHSFITVWKTHLFRFIRLEMASSLSKRNT